ncbi:P-loop containing nucleoside triphosphate hydrolase protein [Echria macrotheca]|uniref:RNA helicase n=1 Tax=Echria macrotheca TaxID=438768 RepID=A0AAJ0B522_9PEZI|nr:P-loop containing nucleoside triphosphate hydrolase protein [Echria macrotheca]
MWKTATRDSVCLLCRSSSLVTAPGRTRVGLEEATGRGLWTVQQRWLATRRQTRPQPARMVLSDRVDRPRPPPSSSRGGDATRKPRNNNDRPAGPFAAMNRTVANVGRDRERSAGFVRTRDPIPTTGGRGASSDNNKKRGGGGDRKKRDDKSFKALNMQRSLATIGYGARASVKEKLALVESFEQFALLPVLKEAVAGEVLRGLVDVKPTPVQRLAIPALLGQDVAGRGGKPARRSREMAAAATEEGEEGKVERREFLLAAETGSGKTLAYLLPAINALKEAEASDEMAKEYQVRLDVEKRIRGDAPVSTWIETFEPHPNMARPRVIVLVPTAELVSQVYRVAKALSHAARFKVRRVSADMDPLVIRNKLYSPLGVDVVVATPHLLASMARSDPFILSRVTHLVIDEADSLLDRSFAPETTAIVDRAMPTLKQLVLCSATIPRRLDSYLVERFPNIERITTPNLHAIPRRVQLGVIDVSRDPYRNNKLLACADAIYSIGREAARHELPGDEIDVKRIMVFVNERETTQEVADYLVSKGIDAVALHRDTPEHRQSAMLASFTSSEPLRVPKEKELPSTVVRTRRLANTKVIVATDLASRGIDTLAVRHVVLYDVPHTSIDFIHRLGRAGRMGRRGKGVVLVGKGDRRDVVREVKESMFMGQALV